MYLWRQSEGRSWRIYWWDSGKIKSTSTGTTDRMDAERVLLAMKEAKQGRADERRIETLLRAAFAGRGPRGLALDAVAAEYLEAAPKTKHSRLAVSHWSLFVVWAKQHRPGMETLADIDPAVCRAYVPTIAGTPKTVANTIGDCARVYRVVAPMHGLSGDPWRGIRVSRATAKPARDLTSEEVNRLLAATTGEYHGAVLVGLYTGLRYRDVAHLSWDDIVDGAVRLKPAKTGRHGIRVVIPVHRRLRAYLDALPRAGQFIFPELAETYPRRQTARRFMYARRAAELPSDVTFHSLRHTFVSRLANARVPEDVRMLLAGHSDATTHARYNHDEVVCRAAIDQLE